jgi:hypothetical protein
MMNTTSTPPLSLEPVKPKLRLASFIQRKTMLKSCLPINLHIYAVYSEEVGGYRTVAL